VQTVRSEAVRTVPGCHLCPRAGDARPRPRLPRGLFPVCPLRETPGQGRPLRHAGQSRLLQNALRRVASVRAALRFQPLPALHELRVNKNNFALYLMCVFTQKVFILYRLTRNKI